MSFSIYHRPGALPRRLQQELRVWGLCLQWSHSQAGARGQDCVARKIWRRRWLFVCLVFCLTVTVPIHTTGSARAQAHTILSSIVLPSPFFCCSSPSIPLEAFRGNLEKSVFNFSISFTDFTTAKIPRYFQRKLKWIFGIDI